MPGPGIEDDIYSSYTARPRLPDLDDGDVDSPVLGLWADVEEKRVRGRRSGHGECCVLRCVWGTVRRPRMDGPW